jgi:nucleoside-diphosphate-sugar epimerase
MSDSNSELRLIPPGSLLVTGATGFLGGVLVRRLLANGLGASRLRCVVRDLDRAERGGLPRESLVEGDLSRPDCGLQLRTAADGAAVVIHLAGSLKSYDRRGFDVVNVHGTQLLADAVVAAAPEAHFVHVSSLAAAGPSIDGHGTANLADRCRTVSNYGESKRRGELAVVSSGLPYTILRPPVVYGPGDGATQLLFRQALWPITAMPLKARPLSVIHADDVAEAAWLALTKRPLGAVLPLDGPERTDTHQLLRAIAASCGRSARLVPVPMAIAALAASATDLLARLRNKPGYFNRDKVREIGAVGWVADGEPAKRSLGFEARVSLAVGLAAVAQSDGFARL